MVISLAKYAQLMGVSLRRFLVKSLLFDAASSLPILGGGPWAWCAAGFAVASRRCLRALVSLSRDLSISSYIIRRSVFKASDSVWSIIKHSPYYLSILACVW